MDISSLSLNELRRLQTKVEAEIRRRSDTAKKDLLKQPDEPDKATLGQ